MAKAPELPIRVTGDTGPFRRDLRGAERFADSFGSRMAANGRMLRGWATALSVAGLGAAAVARKTLDYADSIDKAARAANIGAERLQTLRFAAEQSGISTEKMDGAMAKFNITLGRVMSGMETASSSVSQAFDKLGLSAEEMRKSGLSTEQTLDVVLARLSGVEDGAEQAAIAAQLFGRSAGPEMRNLLANGIDGLKDLEQAAIDAGNVIDEALISRGVEIADKWHSIMSSMSRSTFQFALKAATAIDNALGFTDSGKISSIQLDMNNAIDEYADLEERFAKGQAIASERGRSVDSSPQLTRMRDNLSALSEEINRYNVQLLEFSSAAQERDSRLARIADADSGLTSGDLPESSGRRGGAGGGATPTQGDLEKLSERWKTKLELLQEFQASELQILADARAQNLISEEEYQEKLTLLNKEHADKRSEIARLEATARISTMLGAGEDILGALGAFNEKALKASQVFGAAQALISTFQGQAEALKLPFPANLAAAAAVGAKGLALVGAIRSVSASGGGGGGGGASTAVNAQAQAQPVERQVAEFRFTGGNILDPAVIVDAINEAYDQGYQIRGVLT